MKHFYPLRFIVVASILLLSKGSYAQLNAIFTASPISGCAPLVVSFSDQSTGNPVSWQWDLGNGTISSQRNPTTTYFNGGVYTVKLTITNTSGQSRTLIRTNYIVVNKKPEVDFSAVNTSGCFPLLTSFTDLSLPGSGSNVSWLWDFGDGNSSFVQNPTHRYDSAGVFSVTLKVTNSGGCSKTFTRQSYIQVSQGVKAGFTNSQPVACNPPETINFTNSTTGPGTLSYYWNFGDGATSTLQNPSHTFNSTGPFNVTLVAQSSLGCIDTFTRIAAVTIRDMQPDFSGPLTICQGVNATFTNTSSPAPVSYSWKLDDGTIVPAGNLIMSWQQPGVYDVMLINQYQTCSDSVIKQITVLAPPAFDFTADDTVDCKAPFTVNFSGPSSGISQLQWNFGDGTLSAVMNPTHTYFTDGNYSVKLRITGSNGCADSLTKSNYIRIQPPQIAISGLPVEGCIPYVLNIAPVISSLDGVASYSWSFGDGGTSSSQFPTHTYSNQGTYTVKLVINTNDGCIDSTVIINAVKVGTKPVADFSAAPLLRCAGEPVNFTNLSVPSDQWLWDFGEGSTSTQEHPQFAYLDTGWFDITLIAWNNGCKDTFTRASYVNIQAPVARFTTTFNCVNKRQVVFTNESLLAQTWQWDFGDGNYSTAQHPVHTFNNFGTYNVKLTVTNGGCTHELVIPVVLINEVPGLVVDTDTTCRNDGIALYAIGLNYANVTGFMWDYGDGITEPAAFVTGHAYSEAGLYTVRVTVTDIRGCETFAEETNFVRVFGPKADLAFTPGTGCIPLNVNFTDQSETDGVNNIVSWTWNPGEGPNQNFTAGTFNHTYNSAGSYYPFLKVTDSYGCADSANSVLPVIITKPVADFNTADTLSCSGGVVQFYNNSTGNGLSWSWNFGDATFSTQQNPVKTYTTDGDYTVQLMVTDLNGCRDTIVKNNFINITSPVAGFSISDSVSSCTPFKVDFFNNSQNALSYTWDFNDGSFSELEDITHYYTTTGVFNAKLTATGQGGCTSVANKTIRVYSQDATLTYAPVEGCSPLTASLNISHAGPVTYLWDLDDGNTISTTDPSLVYTYLLPGDFIPKVIMEDPTGCRIPVSGVESIRVIKSIVNFIADDSVHCDQGSVIFNNITNSNGIVNNYYWSFGDGTFSSSQHPVHNYNTPGSYTVSLITTTENGCVDSITKLHYIKVSTTPEISIQGNSAVCLRKGLSLRGVIIQQDTSDLAWNWNFGNGTFSTVQNPVPAIYTSTGTFPVQLIVSNALGCSDTTELSVTVNPLPQVEAGPDITVPAGSEVTLSATGSSANNYMWTPHQNVACENCQTTVARPTITDSYFVTCTDSNGCIATDALTITVTCSEKNVYIPNTFSPNNDGMNDAFFPRGKGVFSVKNMRIYNRWGELIFSRKDFTSNNAASGWDGKYKGSDASVDVYVYIIEVLCDNNQIITHKGNVTLIR